MTLHLTAPSTTPLYVAASDVKGSWRNAVELYVWRGDTGPAYLATHLPFQRPLKGFTNGLEQLAHFLAKESADGNGPTIYESHPQASNDAKRWAAQGEEVPLSLRPLSPDELNTLREFQKLPALSLAA